MAPLFRSIAQSAILLSFLLTFISSEVRVNAQSVNGATFTTFDVFKNSGFTLCNNGSKAVQSILPRSPRGGRGGRGGGGSSGGSGAGAAVPFIKSVWLPKKADYCQYLKGTGVMIPTKPLQQGYFPWWPTLLLQTITLTLSFIALRVSHTRFSSNGKLPIFFWVVLGVDWLRIIAWFVKSVHGLVNNARFAWVNPVMWLLPFAYATIFYHRKSASSTTVVSYSTVPFGESHPYDPMKQATTTTTKQPTSSKIVSYLLIAIYSVTTIIMWCMSLAFAIYHWNLPSNSTSRTWTYRELDQARQDPTIIGNFPSECAAYLKKADLASVGLFKQNFDQLLSAGLCALAFVVASATMVIRGADFLKNRQYAQDVCKGTIVSCMVATILGLGLGLIATAVYVGVSSGQGKRVELRYTNNLNTTGGCTFGFVNMDKQWGYWDVKDELGYRVVMSLLGAS